MRVSRIDTDVAEIRILALLLIVFLISPQIVGAYALTYDGGSAQRVIDVTALTSGNNVLAFIIVDGALVPLPIVRVGDRDYVPVPVVRSVEMPITEEAITRIAWELGSGEFDLLKVQTSTGGTLYLALGHGGGGSGIETPFWKVSVKGRISYSYGTGVRYAVDRFKVIDKVHVLVPKSAEYGISFRLPTIGNSWKNLNGTVNVISSTFTTTSMFYVFKRTRWLFAGVTMMVSSDYDYEYSVRMVVYSVKGGSTVKIEEVEDSFVTNVLSSLELPHSLYTNPFQDTNSTLEVVVTFSGLSPGSKLIYSIYAGGTGSTKISGFSGKARFTYLAGERASYSVDTVLGKVALLWSPEYGDDALFVTEPIPLLNGAYSGSIYLELLGNEPNGREPGPVEIGVVTPQGKRVLKYVNPASTGKTDIGTAYPLYKVTASVTIPNYVISASIKRYGNLIVYIRAHDVHFDTGTIFSYWGIRNLTITINYRTPAIPYYQIPNDAGTGSPEDPLNSDNPLWRLALLPSYFDSSSNVRLNPLVDGNCSAGSHYWCDYIDGEGVKYAFVLYPSAAYSLFYYEKEYILTTLQKEIREKIPTSAESGTSCNSYGYSEDYYYYGFSEVTFPTVIKTHHIIEGELGDSGGVNGFTASVAISSYTRDVCDGDCAVPNWFRKSCTLGYNDYVGYEDLVLKAYLVPPSPGNSVGVNSMDKSYAPRTETGISPSPATTASKVLTGLGTVGTTVGVLFPPLSVPAVSIAAGVGSLILDAFSSISIGTEISADAYYNSTEYYVTYDLSWESGSGGMKLVPLYLGILIGLDYGDRASQVGTVMVAVNSSSADKVPSYFTEARTYSYAHIPVKRTRTYP